MFNPTLEEEDKQYVLMGLSLEDCEPARDQLHDPSPLRGWAVTPGKFAPVPSFGTRATILEWITWSRTHDRWMRACILEWILMDPTRGAEFIKQLSAEAGIRTRFSGYYTTVATVLVRLRAPEPAAPVFLLDKVERLHQALKTEENWLESARCEVTAREDRVKYFQTTLKHACDGEWDSLIGLESRIPALPPRPPTCQGRCPGESAPAPLRGSARRESGLPVAPHPG